MIERLIETRLGLNEVIEEFGIDTLLTSDWIRLESIVEMPKPFFNSC